MAIKLNRLGLTAEQKKRELRQLTRCCLERRIYDLPQSAPKPPKFQFFMEDYYRLPLLLSIYCTFCRRYTPPAVSLRTPEGPVKVVTCNHCGTKFRLDWRSPVSSH
jgi:hypothetical protein